ncbi:hypothetical protein [Prochlorococcus sp. MIT 1307]|uniref:hypothetical protein n=1 Tax=Prochlorococcus sp. MIT 1307 TaxID=3096219 RepID=UPI002A749BD4|nr:hypothetical protein [Prochlorococcus sp. MIT 1307]
MTRLPPLLWFALIVLILLPSTAGRFLLDLAGGLILTLLALPLLLTGAGWLGWRFLQSKLIQCEFCGASIIKDSILCPACGEELSKGNQGNKKIFSVDNSIPASSATIDITAQDADNTN